MNELEGTEVTTVGNITADVLKSTFDNYIWSSTNIKNISLKSAIFLMMLN